MAYSLGKKIHELRRDKDMTQEALAERMGVTAQAVSKWENDLSAPDVGSLLHLAQVLNVTTDELLGGEMPPEVRLVPEGEVDLTRLMLRILVDSNDGDRVRVNLPVPLIQAALDIGLSLPQITASSDGSAAKALGSVDVGKLFELVKKGAVGKLMEVETADGDTISITVE